MKKRLLVALIALTFFISGCNTCEQTKKLFHQDYQNYPIQVDNEMTLAAFLDRMDSIYCIDKKDVDWPVLMFDGESRAFVQQGDKARLIGVEPTPCMEVEFDLVQILEIIKDDNNYEVEGQRVALDSIPSYVRKHYLNYGKDPRFSKSPEGVGIWIISKPDTKMEELIDLMEHVTLGFEMVCRQYSMDKFDKKLCKTSPEEYAQLKELFPFHLAFKTYDKEPEIKINW